MEAVERGAPESVKRSNSAHFVNERKGWKPLHTQMGFSKTYSTVMRSRPMPSLAFCEKVKVSASNAHQKETLFPQWADVGGLT
jgi:hypothetical protein